jgi:peptidyl-prolyl cis-trans isomerase SurA
MRLPVTILFFAMVFCSATWAGEMLDRIVASVDRHPITRSEVEQEARFTHLLEGEKGPVTPHEEITALGRLVDRSLVNNQIAVFGMVPVTKQDVESRLLEIRKQIPGAESERNWAGLLEQSGLTQADVVGRVSQEIQTLRFIDLRFRSEVRVGPRALQTYYDTRFVPEMKKKNLTPPALEDVQDQIEAILREERVNTLISDWLKSLRSQSRIQTFDPALPLSGFEKKSPDVSDLHFLPLHISGAPEPAKQ